MKLKRGFVLSQEVLPLYLVRLDPPAAPQLPTAPGAGAEDGGGSGVEPHQHATTMVGRARLERKTLSSTAMTGPRSAPYFGT